MTERMSDEMFQSLKNAWSGDKKVFDALWAESDRARAEEERLRDDFVEFYEVNRRWQDRIMKKVGKLFEWLEADRACVKRLLEAKEKLEKENAELRKTSDTLGEENNNLNECHINYVCPECGGDKGYHYRGCHKKYKIDWGEPRGIYDP